LAKGESECLEPRILHPSFDSFGRSSFSSFARRKRSGGWGETPDWLKPCLKNRKGRLFLQETASASSSMLEIHQVFLRFPPCSYLFPAEISAFSLFSNKTQTARTAEKI
jgi:hypothetical protein